MPPRRRALLLLAGMALLAAGAGAWRLLQRGGQVPAGGEPPGRAAAPEGGAADEAASFGGRATVAERVAQCGKAARGRQAAAFRAAGVSYPPARFLLAGFKAERALHLFAADPGRPLAFVKAYPILAASGTLGPKLREGDRQVPEGFYRIESLNPNSLFHLSLRLDYPNAADRARGRADGRTSLGGDIMIHGGNASIGCIAVGDVAIEDLFVLAADAGWDKARVVLSPVDFRARTMPSDFSPPTPWTAALHADLREAVSGLPRARR